MIFLIEFDRKHAKLVSMKRFPNSARLDAQDARANMEFDAGLHSTGNEIVLLEADSEDTVRKTHRRYFEKIISRSVLDNMLDSAKPVMPAA